MPVLMVGLSHNTAAPVEVRERLAFTAPGAAEQALTFLRSRLAPLGGQCVLLSTCNRTELYVSGVDLSTEQMADLLLGARGFADGDPCRREWPPYLVEKRDHRAVEHLFRVTAGLESMILGENDIVRQVKEAFARSADHGACSGGALVEVFHAAFRVSGDVRTRMDLGRGAFSIGHAAAQLAESIHGSLAGRTVLLLGAGAMSETTARHLSAAGASSVLVANRTYDRAVALAEGLGGRAIHYDAFPEQLVSADIVIASTAAPHSVVHREMVEGAMKRRPRRRPLYLIDIAVPRDIDGDVGNIDGVYLFNIDHLQQMVEEELADRRKRAQKAEALIHEEALSCASRLRTAQVAGPLVTGVRARHHAIVEGELSRLRQRLGHLSEADWRAIEASFAAVENKIAHQPTVRIKEYAAAAEASKIETVRELFGLESDARDAEREAAAPRA